MKINQQLNMQVKELQTSTSTQNAIIQEMKKDTEKEKASVINALRKICTPVQIKKLMSSHNVRMKRSSEDIIPLLCDY